MLALIEKPQKLCKDNGLRKSKRKYVWF